ncbi:MAG: HEAT repeat domain-containing protein [Armatimonadota bacterium]
MNKPKCLRWCAVIVASAVVVACLLLTSVTVCQPTKPRIPAKLSSLRDLRLVLDRNDLTSAQKTDMLLSWLDKERRQPTPTTTGFGGGDINSGYIQAQIIKSLKEVGNPLTLIAVISDPNTDPNIIDAAHLALGRMGDITQIPKLINILEHHSEPYFRVIAAETLGSLGATRAIPALERALHDEYTVMGGAYVGGPREPATAYPLRDAAEVALRVLNMPDKSVASRIKAKVKLFETRMKKARKEAYYTHKSVDR